MPRVYAVIDTNVVVSGLLNSSSVPGTILYEAFDGRIIPIIHDDIMREYREVLNRKKFHFDAREIKLVLNSFIKRGIYVDAGPITDLIPDPKDVVFYAVTMENRKNVPDDDTYLVTGNARHFPVKPFVVTPREMLQILDDSEIEPDD